MTNVACTSAILLCAALFGAGDESGRYHIPDSIYFGGANDLALGLVCSLGFSMFMLLQKSKLSQTLGAVEFLVTIYFLLKTGSRGGFLALAAFIIVWSIFSISRWKLGMLGVLALAFVGILPGSTLSRLVEIATPGSLNTASAVNDDAKASQYERTELLKKAIGFAIAHPVLGLGPGTFIDELYNQDVIDKTHTAALGTHNAYAQVASECGFPALFLYLGALFGSIACNFRIMKLTRKAPGAQDVFKMSLCLFACLVAFAVASGFHHVAYTPTMPILTGMTAALALASRNGDVKWIESEIAAGNA